MIFKFHFQSQILFALSLFHLTATAAPLRVVTTLPDLAEVVRSVGGKEVRVQSLLKGNEDAHFVDAMPSFSVKVASADIVCIVGLGLEIGWIPKVLAKSANANVQPGGKGYCEAGKTVNALDVQTGTVDRSMGDVHPEGNPHFHLSPISLGESSQEVLRVLISLRPAQKDIFIANQKAFVWRMVKLEANIRKRFLDAGINESSFMEYHKDFGYFFRAYGLTSLGSIEEKPGVLPSASRLSYIAKIARDRQVMVALSATHSPDKQMKKFSELSEVKVLRLPGGVQASDKQSDTIEKVQNQIADAIIKVKP